MILRTNRMNRIESIRFESIRFDSNNQKKRIDELFVVQWCFIHAFATRLYFDEWYTVQYSTVPLLQSMW